MNSKNYKTDFKIVSRIVSRSKFINPIITKTILGRCTTQILKQPGHFTTTYNRPSIINHDKVPIQ